MKELAFIDPAVFIWDPADFDKRQSLYWSLAAEAVDLISLIENIGVLPVARQEFLDSMISAFPAQLLDQSRPDLRTFSSVVYQFLAKFGHSKNSYPDANVKKCTPDLRARDHFNTEIRSELNSLLNFITENVENFVCFSHELVLGCSRTAIAIDAEKCSVEIDCLASLKNYYEYRDKLTPVYEKHEKHDSFSGYGSKLPNCLSSSDLQALLVAASPVDSQKFVCIFSKKANVHIIFRCHSFNRYHAYPIPSSELSRCSINPNEVPEA